MDAHIPKLDVAGSNPVSRSKGAAGADQDAGGTQPGKVTSGPSTTRADGNSENFGPLPVEILRSKNFALDCALTHVESGSLVRARSRGNWA